MFFRDSLIVNKIELLKTDLEEKEKFLIDIFKITIRIYCK